MKVFQLNVAAAAEYGRLKEVQRREVLARIRNMAFPVYCVVCGGEMMAKRISKQTCSDKCRQQRSRQARAMVEAREKKRKGRK